MRLKNALLLLLTATIWGVAFVAQSAGMEYVGPFTFNCIRCLMGGLVLLPFIWLRQRGQKRGERQGTDWKILAAGGSACGLALFLASNFQQFGIQYTTVGKAGFITACYIVIVPVLGLFFGKRVGPMVWAAVALAVMGLYRLCVSGGLEGMNRGDCLVIACAFLFSIHILVIDHFSPMADGVKLSCIQFFAAGALSGVCMVLFERPDLGRILAAWLPLLYAGILSCGVAYTLQIVGQKGMNPTIASLILSLESGISVLAGWALLGQKMSARELSGCVIMFAAIILAQLPVKGAGEGKKGESCQGLS